MREAKCHHRPTKAVAILPGQLTRWKLGYGYVPLFCSFLLRQTTMARSSFCHVRSGLLLGVPCVSGCQGCSEQDTKQGVWGETPCFKSQSVHMEAACGKSRAHSRGSHTSWRTKCLFQVRSLCGGCAASVHEPKYSLAEPFKAFYQAS